MLSPHPIFRCALFLLTLGLCLPSHAAPGDVIPPVPGSSDVQSQTVGIHKLYLRHVSPEAVLKKLGWDEITLSTTIYPHPPTPPTQERPRPKFRLMAGMDGVATLPDGVTSISPSLGDNSLIVVATPGGFNVVRLMVQNIDVPERRVSVEVRVMSVKTVDLDQQGVNLELNPTPTHQVVPFADGPPAMQLYDFAAKESSGPSGWVTMTTTDDTSGTYNVAPLNVGITPRINPDGTVTVSLTTSCLAPVDKASEGTPVPALPVTITRTVHSGEMMVLSSAYDLPSHRLDRDYLHSKSYLNSTTLLMFVTPTILDAKPPPAAAPPVPAH